MKKETVNDELRDLSPLLHERRSHRTSGFKTPDDYFAGLEDAVFQRLEQEGTMRPPAATLRTWTNRRYLLAAAAAVALLLVAGTWWFTHPTHEQTQAVVEKPELLPEDVENYVLENLHEFEAEQLAALVPGETPARLQERATQPRRNSQRPAVPDLSDEELEQILLDMSDEELENLLL